MSGPKLTQGSINFAKFAGQFNSDMRKKVAELLGNRMNELIRFAPLGAYFETADERKKAFFELVSAATGAAPPSESDQYCSNLIKAWKDCGSSTVLAIETYYFLYTQSYGQAIVEQIDHALFNQKRFKDHFGASVPGAYIERDEQTAHHRTLRPKHELKLQLPAKSSNELHFSNQKLALIGREAEMASLLDFANMEPGFCWLQIAGAAGQGKSRLALELIQRLPEEWVKGFLNRDELASFASKWRQWEPTSPHLIIIDYVHGAEREIGNAMRTLASRSSDFELAVRVLLIERQPWDRQWLHSSATGENGDDDIASAVFANGWATWFYEMNRATDGNDLAHKYFRWNSGLLELQNLSPGRLVQIVRQLAGSKIDMIDDAALEERLARLDKSGRPLYAYFLGLVYQVGQTDDWTKSDLLRATLIREQQKRWPKTFGDRPPNLASDHPALDLAVLASILRQLDCRLLPPETGIDHASDMVRQQAAAMTDVSSDDPLLGASAIIRGVEPDLLGEWFALTAIELNPKRTRLIDEAWRINAGETAAFMLRIVQDFGDHPVTLSLLDNAVPSGAATEAYKTIAQSIYTQLWSDGRQVPSAILNAILKQADSGNADAMTQLGHAYHNGIGTAPDFEVAAYCWLKAAAAGDTGGMVCLAACYGEGKGVTKDEKLSYYWLKQAGERGERFAMGALGNCYFLGQGTRRDMGKAIYWYMEGMILDDQYCIKRLNEIMAEPWQKSEAESAYRFEMKKRHREAQRAMNANEQKKSVSVTFSRILASAKKWWS